MTTDITPVGGLLPRTVTITVRDDEHRPHGDMIKIDVSIPDREYPATFYTWGRCLEWLCLLIQCDWTIAEVRIRTRKHVDPWLAETGGK